MKFLDGQYYVEVKGHRHKIHPTENNILSLLDKPKSLRTQYQVQNSTQTGKNQKVIKNDNDELIVKKILKINNQLFNNQNLSHLIVLVVNEIFGWDLIDATMVEIVNIIPTNNNIS